MQCSVGYLYELLLLLSEYAVSEIGNAQYQLDIDVCRDMDTDPWIRGDYGQNSRCARSYYQVVMRAV